MRHEVRLFDVRTDRQSLCCWWLILVFKLFRRCSADSTVSAQLADVRQRVIFTRYSELRKLPTPCESHFTTLILWMLFDLISVCWRLLSFLSRVILGPSRLPHLHTWVFFINSRLFKIVYGRQGAPEPEPCSCETGRLVDFFSEQYWTYCSNNSALLPCLLCICCELISACDHSKQSKEKSAR